jgi:hypothetical protein
MTPQATEPFSTRLIDGISRHMDSILRVAEGPALWFDVATLAILIAGVGFEVPWRLRHGTNVLVRGH